jgi:hypothetical protein
MASPPGATSWQMLGGEHCAKRPLSAWSGPVVCAPPPSAPGPAGRAPVQGPHLETIVLMVLKDIIKIYWVVGAFLGWGRIQAGYEIRLC